MKITVLTENLKKGLSIISRGISSRPQLPILSGVLLKADSEGMYLISTDLEISFWIRLGAKIEEEGELVMPAKLLTDLVLSLPAGPVSLVSEGDRLKVTAGAVEAEIMGQSAEDFPAIPRLSKEQLVLGTGEFREVIEKVSVSSAKDDTRPILTGLLWDFKDEQVVVVATDGYRLSVDKILPKTKTKELESKLILPSRSLMEVAKVLSDVGEDKVLVEFNKENQQVIFGLKEIEIASRLISGDFPPYQQILPNTYKTRVEVDRLELLEAVKRAKLFAKDNANIVKLSVKDQVLEVVAESSQVGKNNTKMEVLREGDEVVVAFNANYLLDYLSVCREEKIVWETEGELKPSVFKTGDENWLQVVMPVRVQD